MKLLGIQLLPSIPKSEQLQLPLVQDQVPEIKVSIPDTKKPALMPFIKSPALGYHSQKSMGRGAFQPSEYNLAEMGRIEDTDGYVRQAFDKKTALMFKESWHLVGSNKRTIKYIKTRFAQISSATQIPSNSLFRSIGSAIIRKSNAFIVKIRNTEASGGKVRREPGKNVTLKPVAGYFIVPAETMEFELSGTKISKWRQKMPNGDIKQYHPKDVIHIHFDRKEGFVFGTPCLIPVIDDIRALRKIEENIELLIYQHLFPLFQYIVGTKELPAGITETGEREIDVIKREIQFMPTEGGIVTPERHEIRAIGAEGRALQASDYLEHFKKRVFSGMGVSAVDMGEGECYSNDTQTLTENGWKYHWNINHDQERIATYNPETKELEYHIANYKYEGHYEGDMFLFKGKHFDIKVSPKHEMWVLNRATGEYKKIFAMDLYAGVMKEFCFIDTVSKFQGIDSDVTIGDKIIDSKVWMDYLGWWISEGSVDRYNASQDHYRTIITQKKIRNLDAIRDCLSKLPFNYREQVDKRDGTVNFIIYSKELYLKLEPLGTSLKKTIPKEFLEYDSEHCSVLLNSLMRGDGTWDTREGRKSGIYYTASKQLADDVQIIALQAGYSAKVTSKKNTGYSDGIIYRVLITKSDKNYRILTTNHVSVEKYSNTIYCYNIPNHLFITRRNGIVGIHGNTANRATADNMSRNLVDSVKDLQQILEDAINEFIIKELLLESTFGSDVLDEDNMVRLKFKEIDTEAKIKKEAHAVDMFNKDAINHDEVREVLGKEPILLPTPEESQNEQDTAEAFPEWNRMRWVMFERPKLLMQALDEPYSLAAMQARKDNSISVGPKDIEEAGKKKNEQEITLEKEKTKAKIAVAKAKPAPRKVSDSLLKTNFIDIKEDIVSRVNKTGNIDHDWISQLIRTSLEPTKRQLVAESMIAFREGFASAGGDILHNDFINISSVARSELRSRIEYFITKLANNITSSIQRNTDNNMTAAELTSKTRAIFESMQFRTDFIEDVEIRKAKTLGQSRGFASRGISQIFSIINSSSTPCPICISKHNNGVQTNFSSPDMLPPHHAHCNCFISTEQSSIIIKIENAEPGTNLIPGGKELAKKANVQKQAGNVEVYPTMKDIVRKCPNCGRTATKPKGQEHFACMVCDHTFGSPNVEEEVNDKIKRSKHAQFRRCVSRFKNRLKSKKPTMDDDKLEELAETACGHLRDQLEKEEDIDRVIDEIIENATLGKTVSKNSSQKEK